MYKIIYLTIMIVLIMLIIVSNDIFYLLLLSITFNNKLQFIA